MKMPFARDEDAPLAKRRLLESCRKGLSITLFFPLILDILRLLLYLRLTLR